MDSFASALVVVTGFIVALVGLAGCIVPFIPGPPISYSALILLSLVKHWEVFSPVFLAVMAAMGAAVMAFDFLLPALGAKRYGASRLGMAGSIVGSLLGIFLMPPVGIFIGGLAGAILGEMLWRRSARGAFRAGFGVFIGTAVGLGAKLAYSGLVLFYYVREAL